MDNETIFDGELCEECTINLDGEVGAYSVAATYADLPDKPSINGQTLIGDVTIATTYAALPDKPRVNGQPLVGDVTIEAEIDPDIYEEITSSEIEALWDGEGESEGNDGV